MSKATAKHIFLYGIIGGILIAALRWSEYRFLVIDHSLEIYSGLIAATFAAVGIWLGPEADAKTGKDCREGSAGYGAGAWGRAILPQ